MPRVNPEIMVWARETAGLTQEEAARKLGFRNSSISTASEKLAAVECGRKEPSRPQLVKMAGRYHRPLLTFYLSKPPKQGDRGTDFRTLSADRSASDEARLDTLVRDIKARQSMVRAVLEDEDEAEPLTFIGSHRIRDGKAEVLGSLQALIDVDMGAYRAQRSPSAAFELLRGRLEASGAFVMLKGDLGNYVTAIDTAVFRGFSIADNIAPFVVINDRDAKSAWSFTLLHETVHLLLGQTGVSGEFSKGEFSDEDYSKNETERFCDDIAGEFLLPADALDQLYLDDSHLFENVLESVNAFANESNVSRAMVAYKAYRSQIITLEHYRRLKAVFRQQWREERERDRAQAREQEGGPNYYTVRRHRLGDRTLGLVGRMMAADALSTSKAARILGVKPRQVQPLLDTGSRYGR